MFIYKHLKQVLIREIIKYIVVSKFVLKVIVEGVWYKP